ncbi:DUF2911 domain-containing protein [Ravibacter arvi]|uniref:DUF2911 domain-containing protein n=1 Tax=Ravibacter arvi TaxID=2051041 RepID=A0ABP8M0V6_9BACT
MKKFTFLFSILLALLVLPNVTSAQLNLPQASPSAIAAQGIGLGEARIDYHRPSLKGRKMFGSQVPYGSVWRTGANQVTTLTLSREMEVAGNKVAAGKYALFTIPAPGEWTVILSKDAEAWGAYTYNEANDVLRFKVKSQALSKPVEFFTIRFDDFTPTQSNVVIEWERTQIKFPVKQDADAEIMEQIKTLTAASDVKPMTLIGAANYYLDTNRELNTAFEWASKGLESNKMYWAYALRAKIAAKIGKCDVAVEDAKTGLPGAKKANDMSYVQTLEKIIKECGK